MKKNQEEEEKEKIINQNVKVKENININNKKNSTSFLDKIKYCLIIIRTIWWVCMLVFTVIVGCPLYQLPGLLIFYLWSRSMWRSFNSMFIELWKFLLLVYIEEWNGIQIVVTGDHIPKSERAFIICNHPSETDWGCFFPLAYRKGMLGHMKIVLKKELRLIPGIGQAMDSLDWIFLDRVKETDTKLLHHRFRSWDEDKYRLWLFFFPEGTDFSEQKRIKSIEYAKRNNLPYFKYHLVPRVSGFNICINELRNNLDAVYDITLAYPGLANHEIRRPTPLRFLLGTSPRVVHAHIKRYPIETLPTDENGQTQWLFDRFKEKDQLVENFRKNKDDERFEDGEGGRHTLQKPKLTLRLWFLWWMIVVSVWLYWLCTSWTFIMVVVAGNVFQIVRIFSPAVRRWSSLLPPLNFVDEKSPPPSSSSSSSEEEKEENKKRK